jgi:hypothetical protein
MRLVFPALCLGRAECPCRGFRPYAPVGRYPLNLTPPSNLASSCVWFSLRSASAGLSPTDAIKPKEHDHLPARKDSEQRERRDRQVPALALGPAEGNLTIEALHDMSAD